MLTPGIIQVYTGDGKGKTTAAVGQAVRALGAGLRVCFIQFVKGGPPSGELRVLSELGIEVIRPAVASTGLLGAGITEEDRHAALTAWSTAADTLATGAWDVVVLDELNIALKYGLVDLPAVLQALAARPSHVEVVITGRGLPSALRDAADLVTEMIEDKHPYSIGIAARKGIEF